MFILKLTKTVYGIKKHYFHSLHGKKHGREIVTDNNDMVLRNVDWFYGVRHGIQTDYDTEGNVKAIIPYSYNRVNGEVYKYDCTKLVARELWNNGQKCAEETYSEETGFMTRFVDYMNHIGLDYHVDGPPKNMFWFGDHEYDITYQEIYDEFGHRIYAVDEDNDSNL